MRDYQSNQFLDNLSNLASVFQTPALAHACAGATGLDADDRGFIKPYLASSGGEQPRRVRVERRRQQQTAPRQRQRAEASRRERPRPASSGGGTGGGAGGGLGGGLGGLGGGGYSSAPRRRGPSRGGMGIGGLLLIGLFLLLQWWLGGNNGNQVGQSTDILQQVEQAQQAQQGVQSDPIALATLAPLRTPAAAVVSAGAGTGDTAGGDTWTIMLYQDADDQVLERDIHVDLNEAEIIGSTDNVNIVAQIDRFRGGYRGDDDITSAKRYFVRRDNDLNRVGSQELMDLGEVNMADGNTLVDFVTWAMEEFPADKYALILSDHGMGWPGGWTDPTAPPFSDRNNPLSQAMGDMLYMHEIDAALQTIRDQTGLDKFELIGMDACLMAHIEVFTALAPHARYAVASQEVEPAVGWAYSGFLDDLVANSGMTGGELGAQIVETYIAEDQRILDPSARAEFAGRASAQQVATQLYRGVTLTAADLSQMPALNAALNDYVYTLQGLDQRIVAQARSYTQSYTSVFGRNVPASYLDIGHFLLLTAQQSQNQDVINSARPVAEALQSLVIAETHGSNNPSATGLSIYFPNSELIRTMAGPASYNVVAQRFVNESLWDDFLIFHYTGNQFAADTRVASSADIGAMRSPASGGISVDPIWASADTVDIQETVLLTTVIEGENLGHIKLMVGELDPEANAIRIIDADYLQAPETVEVNGTYYPDWGEGAFIMEFEWEPYVTAITDGETTYVALFTPEDYGRSAEDAVYSVDGTYTIADGSDTRHARMYFRDGVMTEVYGFTNTGPEGASNTGAPWQITVQPGDTFTVLDVWIDVNADGTSTQVEQEGATFTMSEEPLRWVELDAAAGQYTVGFIVEDLDGIETPVYTQINVAP